MTEFNTYTSLQKKKRTDFDEPKSMFELFADEEERYSSVNITRRAMKDSTGPVLDRQRFNDIYQNKGLEFEPGNTTSDYDDALNRRRELAVLAENAPQGLGDWTAVIAGTAWGSLKSEPLNFVPFVGGAKAVKTTVGLGKKIATGAKAGAISSAAPDIAKTIPYYAQEKQLQNPNAGMDAAMNLGGSLAFGGALGAAGGVARHLGNKAVNKYKVSKATEAKMREIKAVDDAMPEINDSLKVNKKITTKTGYTATKTRNGVEIEDPTGRLVRRINNDGEIDNTISKYGKVNDSTPVDINDMVNTDGIGRTLWNMREVSDEVFINAINNNRRINKVINNQLEGADTEKVMAVKQIINNSNSQSDIAFGIMQYNTNRKLTVGRTVEPFEVVNNTADGNDLVYLRFNDNEQPTQMTKTEARIVAQERMAADAAAIDMKINDLDGSIPDTEVIKIQNAAANLQSRKIQATEELIQCRLF